MSDLDTTQPESTRPESTSPTPAARGRASLRRLAPWVLLALALAIAVASTAQWRSLAAAEEQRGDVERTAASFVLTLTTWDATQGMAATREELREAGTERFAGEVDELFGTTEDLAGLEEVAASSQGEVRHAFVQEIDGDRALALVVATQRLTADVVDGEEVSVRYAEVALVRSGGGWLVDDVELLVDVADEQAGASLPGGELEDAP
jgi:hypothetical protein